MARVTATFSRVTDATPGAVGRVFFAAIAEHWGGTPYTAPHARDIGPRAEGLADAFSLSNLEAPGPSATAEQVVFSPNPDGGEGPDTIKGNAFRFIPVGDRDATDVRIRLTALHTSDPSYGYPPAVFGVLRVGAPAWATGVITSQPTGWVNPWYNARTEWFAWAWPTDGTYAERTSPNLAAAYNAIRRLSGFTPGEAMVWVVCGLPQLGGMLGSVSVNQPVELDVTTEDTATSVLTMDTPSVSGSDATLAGSMLPGCTVGVTSTSGTPGAVNYPDATHWTCVVSGASGTTTATASASEAGTVIARESETFSVSPPVEVSPSSASLALTAAAPSVSTPTWRVDVAPPSASLAISADAPTVELVDASPLSLPAWVWNGSEYVRASFHLLA